MTSLVSELPWKDEELDEVQKEIDRVRKERKNK